MFETSISLYSLSPPTPQPRLVHFLKYPSNCSFRRRQWHPTPVLLPGKSQGRRSLVGCSPWGRYESDTTERLFTSHFHALEKEMATHSKCSCLENPRDGEAWWATVYGVAQSQTRLKRLSSSSNWSVSPQNAAAAAFVYFLSPNYQVFTPLKDTYHSLLRMCGVEREKTLGRS